MVRKRFYLRAIATFFLLNMLMDIFAPAVSFALTSGPSQPEFSSFEPVATTNMVNTFSGDFTYNLPVLEVPGPHGSGYPLTLSYHSGLAPEEEASWVGYGFSLNAGAINRSMRGFPDDYNDKPVTYFNKTPKNWTVTLGGRLSLEFFSKIKKDEFKSKGVSVSANRALRYNNYKGFGKNAGIGLSLGKGLVSMGYNLNDGDGSFSLGVNPMALLSGPKTALQKVDKKATQEMKKEAFKKNAPNMVVNSMASNGNISVIGSNYGILSMNEGQRPTLVSEYEGESYNVSVSGTFNPGPVPIGGTGSLNGSYSFQRNKDDGVTNTTAHGFMYSSKAGSTDMMDYHVEKESNFNKRDVFLGVPFNDADMFSATGEGIVGSFRLYHNKVGNFSPREASSHTDIFNISAQGHVGNDNGVGVTVGNGRHDLTVSHWNRRSSDYSDPTDKDLDEPVFFRFSNDMGGSWGDKIDDAPLRAYSTISLTGQRYGNFDFDLRKNGKRSGRSSYIGYSTNEDMTVKSSGKYYKAYSKREDLISDVDRSDLTAIGELAVFNETGSRYVYALPVRSKNEYNISYGVKGAPSGAVVDNHLIYYKNSAGRDGVKVGSHRPSAYASAYLLTEITTPDYVDRSYDGPTIDDFGGYTKFNYDRLYGGNDAWYKWRSPYAGLSYQRNSLSDKKDDLGTVSHGEKEIYHLNSIETKTHIAVFDTDSEARDGDSFEANTDEDEAVKGNVTTNRKKLKRLNKIRLYSRSALKEGRTAPYFESDFKTDEHPIKTVHFEYASDAEELMKGAPNAAANRGKLTLKKVYFTYNGYTPSRLRPYVFDYNYARGIYPSKYSEMDNYASGTNENPPYSIHNSDAWSGYQPDGKTQHEDFKPWLNQILKDNEDFDPAAWHVKQITLPSGGQIHVQYESDDYSFVQDHEAHVMVPLASTLESPTNDDHEIYSNNQQFSFKLNAGDIGVTTEDQMDQFVSMISKRYKNTGKKIYFKFLYSLRTPLDQLGSPPAPDLSSCNVEYITGYADLSSIKRIGSDVMLELKTDDKIPREVCQEFVKTQRMGMINTDNCDAEEGGLNDQASPKDVVLGLAEFLGRDLVPKDIQLCKTLNSSLSYFRLPTPLPKRGGGLRVKRLLTFDNTLQGAVLYGNEYLYETLEEKTGRKISSGVATNEPAAMREENVLVDYIKRKGQSDLSKLAYGEDKKQSEGPIGESIMPGPSVGYSKVITKNIHQGQTTTGYSVADYYTAHDYPVYATEEDRTSIDDSRQSNFIAYTGIVNKFLNHQYVTQGFRFVMNNMHGQSRKMATYAGRFKDLETAMNSPAVTEQVNTYFEPGESVKVMDELYGKTRLANPGREVDITIAQKGVEENSRDAQINLDFTVGTCIIPIPWISGLPTITTTEGKLYTHATAKVIRYPAILKSTTTYQDGIYHTSENLAFSESTGQPVVVKSYDEFKGAYLSHQVPAEWEYPNFKQKATAERLVITASDVVTMRAEIYPIFIPGSAPRAGSGKIYFEGQQGCEAMSDLSTGDLLEIGPGTTGNHLLYHITNLDYASNSISVTPSVLHQAVPIIGAELSKLTVVMSGRNNNLNQQAGSITFHDSDHTLLLLDELAIDPDNRYIDGNESQIKADDGSMLLRDLNNAFDSQVSGESGSFTLTGTYEKMNMSAYKLDCDVDPYSATVENIRFDYYLKEGAYKLVLKSFCITCQNEVGCTTVQ